MCRALATLAVLGFATSVQAQTVTDFFRVAGNGTAANTFIVPTGVTSLFVTLEGGGGSGDLGTAGGSGALVSGDLIVTPGEGLIILSGGGGSIGSAGRSAIQFGKGTSDIVDAGAGGNAMPNGAYGGNGGFTGDSGGGYASTPGLGGGGGTQSNGGAGGPGYAGYGGGFSGTQYHGGAGNFGGVNAGAAGGDGYFGGGNGAAFSGGGGGSSLTSGFTANLPDPTTVTNGGAHNAALSGNGGDGFVEIQFNSAPVPEASTTVSLGLLLALGVGGVTVARKRRKAQGSSDRP